MNLLNKYIDHTLLKPSAKTAEIKKLCAEAREYDFASVCINPCYVTLAKEQLLGSDVKVCTVIGFPLGATETEAKAEETRLAYAAGCDEFDMVINIGALKDGRDNYVFRDISAVVSAANGRCVKVIIETFCLTDEEKTRATEIACSAGASFVKTCTGFCGGGANAADIRLMKKSVTNGVLIKASAGIRTYSKAVELILAGANRIGTSAGVAIMLESKAENKL